MLRVIRAMGVAMQRSKVGKTGAAASSFSYNVSDFSSTLSFDEALRFVDMGVGFKHPLGGLTKTRVALQASRQNGDVFVKDSMRKPKKIYAKVAYGNLNWLEGKILYGFTEETIAMLKEELTS